MGNDAIKIVEDFLGIEPIPEVICCTYVCTKKTESSYECGVCGERYYAVKEGAVRIRGRSNYVVVLDDAADFTKGSQCS